MGLTDFFLICFFAGLIASVVGFFLGSFDLDGGDGGDGGHGTDGGHGHHDKGGSFINFHTVTAFVTWFGGIGWVLVGPLRWQVLAALLAASGGGLLGGWLIYLFITRFLMKGQTPPLNPADFELAGTLARVSSSIRAGGTGEIVYSQGGTRHTLGARAEDGQAIARGEEVVVVRYERGIAYVQTWAKYKEDSGP